MKALECLGGFTSFEKRARDKISNLLQEEVAKYGKNALKELSDGIDVPFKTLELLCDFPELVPISADLVESLACPLNISMTHFFSKPNLNKEDREYFRKCIEDDGFSVGLHPEEKNPFDMETLYVFLLGCDAVNFSLIGEENVFLNKYE
jgi:hypothetical protein